MRGDGFPVQHVGNNVPAIVRGHVLPIVHVVVGEKEETAVPHEVFQIGSQILPWDGRIRAGGGKRAQCQAATVGAGIGRRVRLGREDGVAIRPVEVPVPLCKNIEETHRRVYLVIGEIKLYQVRVGPCLVGAGVALNLLMLGHPVQIPVEACWILLKLVQHPGPVFKSPFRIRVPPRKAVLGFAQIAALHLDGGNVLIIHRANGPLAAGGCGYAAQVAHGVGKHKLRVPPLLQQLGN